LLNNEKRRVLMNGNENRGWRRPTADRIDAVRQKYPVGKRIELKSLCNYETGMPSGLRGTVTGVDDQPALLMRWDNGRTLSLLPGDDCFSILVPEAVQSEQEDGPAKGPVMDM
jgi:hypothetical protein